MRKSAFSAIFYGLTILLFVHCGEKIEPGTSPSPGNPAIQVEVVDIKRDFQPVYYEAVGTVKARLSTTISSKLTGIIETFHVKEGDEVRQNDLLVLLDERQVVAGLNQARAALAEAEKAEAGAVSAKTAAEAGAINARLSYERYRKMLEGQAITPEAFENVEAQHKQAQAALEQADAMVAASRFRVQQAQAAVDSAVVVRQDARLLAPFEGKVTAKLADAGSLATPGMPLLELEQKGGYRVDLIVPEAYIHSIEKGQEVSVTIPATGDAPIPGETMVIIPLADQGSRTFVIQVSIPTIDTLRSGMFARVSIKMGDQLCISIPPFAVVHQGQLTGVFVVDENHSARFRLIRTGRITDKYVEVISGIREGTLVILKPTDRLANGDTVEIMK